MTEFPPDGRLAGIDFGTVRIGIAVTDVARKLASPYENYTRRGAATDATRFQQLVRDENVVGFIVGLPNHLSGAESQKSREVREFADWLQRVTGRPVRLFDERYSTAEASQLLGDAQLTRKRRKKRLDMIAAQLILAAFLESHRPDDASLPLDDC